MDTNTKIENVAENKVYEGIFNIFELELEEISRFVALTSSNMNVYSNKIHELHLRVCSEIENILKIVIHKHFVSADEIKTLWDSEKSTFLEKKSLTPKYKELRSELNNSEKGKLDKFLFGFPDFLFYFKLACEKFNLHKKVIKFAAMVSHNSDWEIIQPFELEEGRDVPIWWSNYNKLKHDKITNFHLCTLGDLINSFSGLFILMNYLLKYQGNNRRITDRNFKLEKLKGSYGSDCSFCSFESKYFKASHAIQHQMYTVFLPAHLSENDFQTLTILELEKRQMNNSIKNLFEDENIKIKDFDLKSFELSAAKEITKEEIMTNKNSRFRSVEHSLFYTYVDYVKKSNLRGEYFRELRHFGVFIN